MNLATRSLPVPLSPVIRTLASVGATLMACSSSRAMTGLEPRIPSPPTVRATCRRSERFSTVSPR